MRKAFTIPLLLFFLNAGVFAQTGSNLTLLSVNEGLSQGMVFDVLQSRDGFLWIATKDGLNRYDGYRFEVFSPDVFNPFAIGDGEIRKLFEDSQGRIWLNHLKGLDVFVPQTGRFFHLHKPQLPIFTGHENAASPLTFAETPDGVVWIADLDRLWRIELPAAALEAAQKAGNAYPKYTISAVELPLPDASGRQAKAVSVFFSKRHGLMVGTTHGLYHLDSAGPKFLPVALSGAPLHIAGEDNTGAIWLKVLSSHDRQKAPDGFPKMDDMHAVFNLAVWDRKTANVLDTKIGQHDLVHFEEGKGIWTVKGHTLRLWQAASLRNGGDPTLEWTCTEPFTRSNEFNFQSLTSDRSDLVWLGTSGYGVVKFNPEKPKFNSYLPLQSQRAVYEDPEGRFFTFAEPKRMYLSARFDRSIPNPWYADVLEYVHPSVFDAAGNGWRNNDSGVLSRMDARTKTLQQFPWKGYGLIYTQKGLLLSVQEDGLRQFDPATGLSALFPFPQSWNTGSISAYYTHCLYESGDGAIWIFAHEGIIKAVASGTGYTFTQFKSDPAHPNSLSSNAVLCLADDPLEPQRYLWVGTKGGGLNRLDKQTGIFKHFKTAQGLPDNVVYGILTDPPPSGGAGGGHLWLSTNKGLCRFHVRDETAKNFTVADGLQDNEFNTGSYLKTSAGLLIFGGVNGLTVFHPDSLRLNMQAPQTHIVGLSVGNAPHSYFINASLDLSHRQNFLAFEFAALEFTNPAQNRYRYQLVKHNIFGRQTAENWVELGHKNTVQFANLSPGRYSFRVLGSNNDGIWSEQPAVLEFVIRPPWWAAWWAWLFYAGAFSAFIFALYRYQLRQKLEHQESLRLRELDEFKNRFFTNITHEFRTPLTVILGTSEQLAAGSEQWAVAPERTKVKDKLVLIKRNGQNLLRLINQILDLAKLEASTLKINYVQGNVLPYLQYIAESLQSLAATHGIELAVESPEHEIIMDYDPERLLQIVFNLLSNAIKFTPSGGRVVLRAGVKKLEIEKLEIKKLGGHAISNFPISQCQISVSDTGIGIPPEDLPHIFDRFYQASTPPSGGRGVAGGTGIGLALTKELVRAMGGKISVESCTSPSGDRGVGTTFTVVLPVTNQASTSHETVPGLPVVEPPESPRNPVAAEPGNQNDLPRILLIEDNPDVMEYLAACLASVSSAEAGQQRAYTLDFAYNGRTGIEKALETVPDLIVSDVMMPEKDGFEVCEALKNDVRTSHIPIVLLTAKADVESRIAGLRRGADAYLAKPFHEEELLANLTNLLELRRKLQERYSRLAVLQQPVSAEPEMLPAAPPDPEDAFLQKVRAIVEESLSEELDMQRLEHALAMSRSQVFRKIKALTGRSPSQFVRSVRLHHGRLLLQSTNRTVSEIAYEVGFSSVKYFSDAFLEEFGERPTQVRG